MAIAHGASAYLPKPVSDDVLASVARKLCDFRGAPVPEEKRSHPRRPLLVPIEVETWTRPGRALGWMLDASCSGCRIETPEAPATGDAVQVWLPVAEATAHTPLLGRACWTRTLDRAWPWPGSASTRRPHSSPASRSVSSPVPAATEETSHSTRNDSRVPRPSWCDRDLELAGLHDEAHLRS